MPADLIKGGSGAFDYDEHAVMRAWERLLSERGSSHLPSTSVRSLIHDSWARAMRNGIDADTRAAPICDSDDQLSQLRRANRELCEAAAHSLAQIGPLLESTKAMLILTDAKGVIIETIGDHRTLDDGRRIHLQVGGVWNEAAVGTNGIGTALSTGRPVLVHAAEHFCADIKAWTCAGAPIIDLFDNSVAGLVDLSGPTEIFRPHNKALIVAAANEIQLALVERRNRERLRLLETFFSTRPAEANNDAFLILDQLGRLAYLWNVRQGMVYDSRLEELVKGQRLLGQGTPADADNIADALPDYLKPSDISLIRLDGEVRGCALIFSRRGRSASTSARSPATTSAALRRTSVGGSGTGQRGPSIIGRSAPLLEAIETAQRVASTRSSILVTGETGVGKELFARLLHDEGRKSDRDPFIDVNCGAFSRELFGDELFGHVAGAFTGASRTGKPGKFELADGGVLCLDEIGELPLDLQPYLLRVMEQRAVHRVGDTKSRPVDVHLIALTNRNLTDEVAAGRFREDLYYRISAITIEVPPLRARGAGDIELLLDHFNLEISARLGRPPLTFSEAALDKLLAHPWPGNVRELKNTVERLHLLTRGESVRPADLPPGITRAQIACRAPLPEASDSQAQPADMPASANLEALEKDQVKSSLAQYDGNISQAAKALGISRQTLHRKIKRYAIKRSF